MIRLKLDQAYLSNKEINDIFMKLSKKVIKKAKDKGISLKARYYNTEVDLLVEENLQSFLLAEDFYRYDLNNGKKLTKKDIFINEFMDLNHNIKYKSLLNIETTTSEKLKAFHSKYSESDKLEKVKKYIRENNLEKNFSKKNKKEIITSVFEGYVIDETRTCFNYKYLNSDDRHFLINMMGVEVCPYCNMNHIVQYTENEREKTTGDLDHFYGQSTFKEYSLCLFNFIPSCPVCNSRFKLEKEFTRETHIYPYEDSFYNKALFEIKNIIDVIMSNEKINLGINNSEKNKKISKNIKDFKLEKIYGAQIDYIQELLDKVLTYNETYREELSNFDFLESKEDLKDLIFGKELSEEELLNKSFGKLKNDLLRQLEIYD